MNPAKAAILALFLGAVFCIANSATAQESPTSVPCDRHTMVVYEEQGLALHLGFFDAPGNIKSVSVPGIGKVAVPPELLQPATYVAPQLFKILRGSILKTQF
jgi:hypothetical protein